MTTTSTSKESEWELRDGKFFKKMQTTITTELPTPTKLECPNCPQHVARIQGLSKELAEAKMRIEKFEKDQKMWMAERAKLISLLKMRDAEIQKLKAMLEERIKIIKQREVIVMKLQQRIKELEEALAKGGVDMGALRAKEEEIRKLLLRIKELEALLNEKNGIISRLELRIKQLEEDRLDQDQLNAKQALIIELQAKIKSLETQLADKNDYIRSLELQLHQRDADNSDLRARLEAMLLELRELQEIVIFCRTHHVEKVAPVPVEKVPPIVETKWYYAVQSQHHADLFQNHPRYKGGSLVVESLDGATVVDPEYYTVTEHMPGDNRLRVRVVEATDMLYPTEINSELFIRLKLGPGVQFTPPRQLTPTSNKISWNQDFLFVSVPTQPHPNYPQYLSSAHPLVIEAVARQVGTANESVVASGVVDLKDLVKGLTRVVVLVLNQGGSVHIRIKSMDFGLPNTAEIQALNASVPNTVVNSVMRVSSLETARALDMADGVLDGKIGSTNIRLTQPRTSYRVGDLHTAQRLDALDGVIDGQYNGNSIHLQTTTTNTAVPIRRLSAPHTSYRVPDYSTAAKLDSLDGVIDGKYQGADIRVRNPF